MKSMVCRQECCLLVIWTKHPCFNQMRESGEGYRIVGELANTDRIIKDTFWVGVYPGMTDVTIDYVAQVIREAVN